MKNNFWKRNIIKFIFYFYQTYNKGVTFFGDDNITSNMDNFSLIIKKEYLWISV